MKLAFLTVAAALAACADYPAPMASAQPAASSAGSQCFDYADMRGHTFSPDNRTIYLNIADREVFQLDVDGTCLGGAISGDPLVIVRRGGSGPSVCSPVDLDISVKGAGDVTKQCIVRSIRRLTPAEAAALPPKVRP